MRFTSLVPLVLIPLLSPAALAETARVAPQGRFETHTLPCEIDPPTVGTSLLVTGLYVTNTTGAALPVGTVLRIVRIKSDGREATEILKLRHPLAPRKRAMVTALGRDKFAASCRASVDLPVPATPLKPRPLR